MIGKYILNYQIDEIIERGGMSTVYLGIHKYLKRKVAIKHLSPNLATNPENRKRFKNEALQLASFNHPNIVTLYDYIENEYGFFIITEFVEGRNLADYIEEVSGPMPESKALNIMFQILDAVGDMHSQNIIHRDIKSSNFIINQDNEIKVIDFGIAKSLNFNQNIITQNNTKIGTTFFMSPQQVQGKVLDRRTDIYSLGIVLFHMLTGQYPYDENMSEYEIHQKIITEPIPDPRDFYVGISDNIYAVVQKATAKNPLQRYQSCSEFAVALSNAQKRKVKNEDQLTLGIKTRILEASNDIKKPLFSVAFYQNLLMLLSTVLFLSIIGFGIYVVTKKDVRHVISGKMYLMQGDSLNAKPLEQLYYGETVNILEDPNKAQTKEWIKVSSLRNTVGYVQQDFLARKHVYKQINALLGNSMAQQTIPVKFKKFLRKVYVKNRLYDKENTDWILDVDNQKEFEFNTISFADYNQNEVEDLACVITNQHTEKSQLVLLFDDLKKSLTVDFDEPVKIRTLQKGVEGGRWYLGNNSKRVNANGKEYTTKKYEYLKQNGILLMKTQSKKNIICLYNKENHSLIFLPQS